MAATQVKATQLKDNDITDADIAAANKDGVAGTPSMRTLGSGALQAMAGNATPGGPPTGSVGGDLLSGTYPNPTVAALKLTGYIYGFQLAWLSTTTLSVSPGNCRDKADATFLALTVLTTITITSPGGAAGNDSFVGPGTAATNSANATITGTSTTFFTSFGTRALTGTISSAVAVVTGTSTKFLTEIAVGDLIGNTSKGYFQVVSIESNTSLTIVSTPASAFSAATVNCIENPTIKVGGNNAAQVKSIESNTSLTIVINSTGTLSTTAYSIGVPANDTAATFLNNMFMYVWIGVGTSGTTVYISTQRTTPYGITNYNVSLRRLGALFLNAATLVSFDQTGISNERLYQIEVAYATIGLRPLFFGTQVAWTGVCFTATVPPTATVIFLTFAVSGTLGAFCFVRKRGMVTGDGTGSRPFLAVCNNSANGTAQYIYCACDAAQCIEYVNSVNTLNTHLSNSGWKEFL